MQLGGHSSKRNFGRKCHTNQRFRDIADDCLTTSAVNMAILCTRLERNYLFAYPRRPSLLPGKEVLKSLETDHFPRLQVSLTLLNLTHRQVCVSLRLHQMFQNPESPSLESLGKAKHHPPLSAGAQALPVRLFLFC